VGAAAAVLAAGYGAMTWYRYGRPPRGGARNPLLDPYMPTYAVRERHEVEIRAPAEVTWASVRSLDLGKSVLIRGIFQARQLLMGGRPMKETSRREAFLDEVLAIGWRILHESPERGMVLGAVTQPWVAEVAFRSIAPEEFAQFAEPNWVKIAWTVEVVPLGEGRSLFRTETRAEPTDREARARFRRYWTVVRPGILLIRREMLRLVKRDAEGRARVTADPQTSGPRLEPAHPVLRET
jgi:hypothetical protein